MKKKFAFVLGIVFFFTLSFSYAADQKDCSKEANELFQELNTVISGYAGTSNYKKMQEEALACFNAGRCGKVDLLLGTQEMMVDEIVIGLQREKLARLKTFLSEINFNQESNDLCVLAKSAPFLIGDIRLLNDKQLARFNYLAQKKFGSSINSK